MGEFRYKIKGNLAMEFGEEVIKFLVKEKFPKFSFIEGAKGNQQNLTFKYMDNCTVNDVKEHIDWAVYSAVQKYGYTDTSYINEKDLI